MSAAEFEPRETPWQIDEADFYEIDGVTSQIAFLIRYAVLAPSGHNTQPWRFRIVGSRVEVFADYTKRMPLIDPADRELLMSVGAAIMNLRVAAAWFGFRTAVTYQTRPEESLPVAVVSLEETCAPDQELRAMFPAIRRRHTNRTPFNREPIDDAAASAICELVERYPDNMCILRSHDHAAVAEIVAEGDRQLLARAAVSAELTDWTRPADGPHCDGICADAKARRHTRPVDNASALIVLSCADDRVSLVQAGEILERLLLTLTLHRLQCSFLNQTIEVDALRRTLHELAHTPHAPQVLLRIGYATEPVRPSPRRPVEAVIERW